MAKYTYINGLRYVNGVPSMNTRRGAHMRLIGVRQALENLAKVEKKTHIATLGGLIKIGAYIEEDMHKTPPTIPKDKGFMANRYRTTPIKNADPTKDAVLIGWANTGKEEYAPYVHEMTNPPYENGINWTTPGSGPKFFEAAINRNKHKFKEIVGNNFRSIL